MSKSSSANPANQTASRAAQSESLHHEQVRSLIERCERAENTLGCLKNRADEADYIQDTILFAVDVAEEYCGDIEASSHWHFIISALAREAKRVLNELDAGKRLGVEGNAE